MVKRRRYNISILMIVLYFVKWQQSGNYTMLTLFVRKSNNNCKNESGLHKHVN